MNRALYGKFMKLGTHVHMPIQVISDMEATLILPVGAVAAIFQNGRHVLYSNVVYLGNYKSYCHNSGAKV